MREHIYCRNYRLSYEKRLKKAVRRQRLRKLMYGALQAVAVLIVPTVIIMVAANYSNNQEDISSEVNSFDEHFEITEAAGITDGNVVIPDFPVLNIQPNPETDEDISEKSDEKEEYGYPEELMEMLDKYPETIDFVMEYPNKKDIPPAGNVGYVQPGEIPLLIQWDDRWGYEKYGDFIIATDGCGPTILAMVIVGLTGDISVTPYTVACFAEENNYYEPGVGSKWTLMTDGAQNFGVVGTELVLCESVIYSELEQGKPIICSVGAGDFTTNGHFIVLTGVQDGKIKVNDPNSRINSNKLWDYETLESQIINLWSYTVQ